jgi:hypothetical protein
MLLKPMGESAADLEPFRMMPERDRQPVVLAHHVRDRLRVDDGRAMHLPEHVRIEFFQQLLERLADQRFAVARDDARVLEVGLEEQHVGDRDQADLRAHRGLDPAQPGRVGLAERDRELRQHRLHRCGAGDRLANARPEPLHRFAQARFRRRFEHVVDRAAFERVDRVLVVCGDEDDVRQALDLRRRLESAHPRHFDVEEHDVRPRPRDLLHRRGAVSGFAGDPQRRPQRGQRIDQLGAQQRLVVGDHRRGRIHEPSSPSRPALRAGSTVGTRTCAVGLSAAASALRGMVRGSRRRTRVPRGSCGASSTATSVP